ncbi:hypothetical protein [Enterococcus durans]|uniref:hypothetical protein n=1 Tax=Enterococcus durans TaxID=53345 RepID=UPI000FFE7D54|nr:hypothetical protein [Enterococcus durans]RXE75380.1 hypothetical protein EIA52_13355 [Enterococcus durans]
MNNIDQKILNFILECKNTPDEREKIEITEILSRCLLHTYVFIALGMIISVIMDRIYFTNSIGTIILILIFLYISGFISIKMRRKSLANINIYTHEEYQKKIKSIKFIGLFNGLYFGIGGMATVFLTNFIRCRTSFRMLFRLSLTMSLLGCDDLRQELTVKVRLPR